MTAMPPPAHGWTRADYYANQTDRHIRSRRTIASTSENAIDALPPGRMLPTGEPPVKRDQTVKNARRPSRAKPKENEDGR